MTTIKALAPNYGLHDVLRLRGNYA